MKIHDTKFSVSVMVFAETLKSSILLQKNAFQHNRPNSQTSYKKRSICILMRSQHQSTQTNLSDTLSCSVEVVDVVLLGRHVPRLRFNLLQSTFAQGASRLCGVNALGMSAILVATIDTDPDVFVINLVGMFGGDLHGVFLVFRVLPHCVGAFATPFLETCAMGLGADARDHKVG